MQMTPERMNSLIQAELIRHQETINLAFASAIESAHELRSTPPADLKVSQEVETADRIISQMNDVHRRVQQIKALKWMLKQIRKASEKGDANE